MVFIFSDLSDQEVFEGKFLLLSQKEILLQVGSIHLPVWVFSLTGLFPYA